MWLYILYIVLGVILVLWGADRLTDGAVGVAEKLRIPQIVIGLTIVAIGTSMPEMCVSLVSALKGTPDLAVGNVVGSNIFNSMLIVGIAALVCPMAILPATVRKDIPFAMVASVVLTMMCLDFQISRLDAAVLFGMFLVFMYITLKSAKEGKGQDEQNAGAETETTEQQATVMPGWKAALLIVVGLVCLILGSNIFVEGASAVAKALKVSDAVIGLTVVAVGTSLPELATTVVSARKGNSGIAIGNVLGSNVFNILLILGVTGLISPMSIMGITTIDLSMLVGSMVLLWLFSFTKYTIERWEGILLTAIFLGYMTYLVYQASS